MPKLPQEIVDMIMSGLSPSSLRACSRVCKSWGYASRRYSFKHISINETNYANFLEILDECTFTSYVQTISLANKHRGVDCGAMTSDGSWPLDAQWLEITLPMLIRAFPRIMSLAFEQISWNDISVGTRELLCEGWRRVKSLTMDWVHFPSANDATQFVQSFPDLDTLSWTRCTQRTGDDLITLPLNKGPGLKKITLDASTAGDPALYHLVSQSLSSSLDLDVFQPYGETYASFLDLNTFLEMIGPRTKSLVYNLWYFDTSDEPHLSFSRGLECHLPVNLSTFHNLENLTLDSIPADPFWCLDDEAGIVPVQPPSLIRSIPSTTLDKITLTAGIGEIPDDVEWYPWGVIDDALDNSSFAESLKEVLVEVKLKQGSRALEMAEVVEKGMVWAHSETDILKVVIW